MNIAQPSDRAVSSRDSIVQSLLPFINDAVRAAVEQVCVKHEGRNGDHQGDNGDCEHQGDNGDCEHQGDNGDCPADYSGFQLNLRCVTQIKEAIMRALLNFGLRLPIDSPEVYLPYQLELHTIAPGLAEEIRTGRLDLIDLANGNQLGTRLLPTYLAETVLTGELVVPYNKILPYNCRKIYANFWGKPTSSITGDQARGIQMGHLWQCLSPPYGQTHAGDTGADPNFARFSLVTAIMTARNAITPKVPLLSDDFYFEHKNNSLGINTSRHSMCGSAHIGAANIAGVWNSMVRTVFNNPPTGTDADAALQPYLFTRDEVAATLGAISLALNSNYEGNSAQAYVFHMNRDCQRGDGDLRRPVCHCLTPEQKNAAIKLARTEDITPTPKQAQEACVQKEAQARNDCLRVPSGIVFGRPHDYYAKNTYNMSSASPSGTKGKRMVYPNKSQKSQNWRRH